MENSTIEEVKEEVEEIADRVKPWVERMARVGFAARGVVYTVMGILALQAALGLRNADVDEQDALFELAFQPFGKILLGFVAAGLAGYAVWQVVLAIEDPERAGRNLKGLIQRLAYTLTSLAYAGLALTAVRLVLGLGSPSAEEAREDWTALLLTMPLGQALILLVGLVIVGIGLYQFYLVYKPDFERQFKISEMSPYGKTWAVRIGRVGHAARGAAFTLIGIFVIQAALQYNPDKAGGLGNALRDLARQPYGAWVLGGLGVGLVAYGLFALILARYSYIQVRTRN